jgi:hypothetical protein
MPWHRQATTDFESGFEVVDEIAHVLVRERSLHHDDLGERGLHAAQIVVVAQGDERADSEMSSVAVAPADVFTYREGPRATK